MPSRILISGACLASGLVIGSVSSALFLSRSEKKEQQQAISVSAASSSTTAVGPSAPAILTTTGSIGASSSAFRAPLAGENWAVGVPSGTSDVLRRRAYVAGYDRARQHPAWTAEHLTIANLKRPAPLPPTGPPTSGPGASDLPVPRATVSRENSKFEEDEEIPTLFRAKLKDYFRSGYDRGHMVPAADAKSSQEAMNETFLLTNIAPQVGDGFNRHYWAYFEDWTRKLTNQFTDVYVFTVPLYLPKLNPLDGKYYVHHEVIGSPPTISVPTHFSKVIVAARAPKGADPLRTTQREYSMAGFVLPNSVIPDEASLESFLVPVESVERASGLSLVSDDLKRGGALQLCRETKCAVTVRRFDDVRKKLEGKPGLVGGGRA